jgi:DNA-binding XRE family transcriptional regulator
MKENDLNSADPTARYDPKLAIAKLHTELVEIDVKEQASAKRRSELTHNQRTEFLLALIKNRIAKNLTQTQLAQQLGMQQSAIARIESGKSNPSLNTLLSLATALGVNLVLE